MPKETHTLALRLDAREANRNAKSLDRNLDSLERTGNRSSSMFAKMSGIIAGIGFGLMAREIFQTNVEAERMRGTLSTLVGGMDNAGKAFDALNAFASSTPFTMEQSVQAFIKMKALGLDPTEAALTSFGNTAVAMGRDLDQMIEAVADASTGEFERLKEFGIIARTEGEEIRFTFQGVTTTVRKEAGEIKEYLQSIGEEKFGTAMADQMDLLPGRVSNLQDSIGNLWRAIGDAGATTFFVDAINRMIEVIDGLIDAIKSGFAADLIMAHLEAFVAPFSWAIDSILLERERVEQADFWGFLAEEGPQLFLDALTLIPAGLKMVIEIMLAVVGGFITDVVLQFNLLDQQLGIVVANIDKGWAKLWGLVKIGAGKAIDFMIEAFADFLQWLGEAMPDIGPFEGWKEDLTGAAEGLREFATAEEEAIAQMEGILNAYDNRIASHERQITILEMQIETNKELTRGEIRDAIKRLQKQRDLLVAQRAQAKALADQNKATVDHGAIIDQLGRSETEYLDVAKELNEVMEEREKLETDVGKKLDQLLGKLDPVIKRENELREMRTLVDKATLLDIISEERRQELLEQLPGLLDTATDAEADFQKALESGIERIDEAFADMWSGFLTDGELSMDGILSAFQQLHGELIQQAMRPITIRIQRKMDAQIEEFGAGPMAAGLLIGGIAGSMVGGGGENAQLGSGLGSMIGSMTPLGPLGGVIGGVLGGMVGGLFDDEPKYELQLVGSDVLGLDKLKGRGSQEFLASALGGFHITNRADTDPAQIDQITKGIVDFDRALASAMDPDQLALATELLGKWGIELTDSNISLQEFMESRFNQLRYMWGPGSPINGFIDAGMGFEEQVKRMTVALSAETLRKESPELFGNWVAGHLTTLVNLISTIGEDITVTYDRIVQELIQTQAALEIMDEFAGSDLSSVYAEQQEAQNRTLLESLRLAGVEVMNLADGFDHTATGAVNLANTLQSRYQLELQMLAQLDSVVAQVTGRFGGLQEMIVSAISTPEENLERMRQRMFQLSESLKTAIDPTDIDRITKELEGVTRSYFSALSPEDQQAMGADLMAWLSNVERLAQERLEAVRADVLSQSEILREEIGILMEEIGSPLTLVANEHGIAAGELMRAADELSSAAESHNHSDTGDLIKGTGVEPNSLAGDPLSQAITSAEISAEVLETEGNAYRQATADMQAAVSQIVSAIPRRIDVDVDVHVADERVYAEVG
jgi:hypothetical protein